MLETSLTDVQVNKFVNQVSISSSFTGPQQAQIKNYFNEYVRMFNGAGFTRPQMEYQQLTLWKSTKGVL